MRQVTARGETIEQAIEQALQQLQTTKEKVEVSIIDEGKKSFLGLFGGRPAVVQVNKKEDPVEEARNYLQGILNEMGIKHVINTQINGKEVIFDLSGDNIAVAIGKRGTTLNSLQFLVQLVANKYANGYLSIVIDAQGYRQKRREVLEHLANKVAREVQTFKKEVSLEPMPSFERKIVHQFLMKYPSIRTESRGQEPYRRIVVLKK